MPKSNLILPRLPEEVAVYLSKINVLFGSTTLLYFLSEDDVTKILFLVELANRGLLIATNGNVGKPIYRHTSYLKPEAAEGVTYPVVSEVGITWSLGFATHYALSLVVDIEANAVAMNPALTFINIAFYIGVVPQLAKTNGVGDLMKLESNFWKPLVDKYLVGSFATEDKSFDDVSAVQHFTQLLARIVKQIIHLSVASYIDSELGYMKQDNKIIAGLVLGAILFVMSQYVRYLDNCAGLYNPKKKPGDTPAEYHKVHSDSLSNSSSDADNMEKGAAGKKEEKETQQEDDMTVVLLHEPHNDTLHEPLIDQSSKDIQLARPLEPVASFTSTAISVATVFAIDHYLLGGSMPPNVKCSSSAALFALLDVGFEERSKIFRITSAIGSSLYSCCTCTQDSNIASQEPAFNPMN